MICLPEPDATILARRPQILAALRELVPAECLIEDPPRLAAYETDGFTAYRQQPLAVVLPQTTAQLAAVVRFAGEQQLRIVPRGAGTSLSGGAIPLADALVIPTKTSMFARGWPSAASALVCKEKHAPMHPAAE